MVCLSDMRIAAVLSLPRNCLRLLPILVCLTCAPMPALADEGDLDEPVQVPEASPPPADPVEPDPDEASADPPAAVEADAPAPVEAAAESSEPPAEAVAAEPELPSPFIMLDGEVPPGEVRQLSWIASESFAGISVPTPVLVAHGLQTGPIVCLTAAVHGDELNGIEMVRRIFYGVDPKELSGTIVGIPIVNMFGFRRNSRYLPDRRDLNRYFPGSPTGSSASRIAYSLFENVIKHCDALVDLHTGSFHRTNLTQIRADLSNPKVLELTQNLGALPVLNSRAQGGTLRGAANRAGVPTITLEAGEPGRFQPKEVAAGVKGVRTLLNKMGMVKKTSLWADPQPVFYQSNWLRADTGGILFSKVELGDEVSRGQVLGTVTDPITNNRSEIRADNDGRILGMALNQVVIPGFAAYRVGIPKTSEEVAEAQPEPDPPETEPPSEDNAQILPDESGSDVPETTTAGTEPPDSGAVVADDEADEPATAEPPPPAPIDELETEERPD